MGWMGLFCPCVLFGRNIEEIKDDVPQFDGCCCYSVCVMGGMVVAVATTLCTRINPQTPALICESLFFTWWICRIYRDMVRQALQKKYHLKVILQFPTQGICIFVDHGNRVLTASAFWLVPGMVHCVLHWCALCQEHREMRNRLSDSFGADTTSIKHPSVQEMSSDDSSSDRNRVPAIAVLSSSKDGNRTSLELQSM